MFMMGFWNNQHQVQSKSKDLKAQYFFIQIFWDVRKPRDPNGRAMPEGGGH